MNFEDENGNPKEVEVAVELSGYQKGDIVSISYSEDGGKTNKFFKT